MATDSPFDDLPPDLVDALRRYAHLIPQSQTVQLVMAAQYAPATTASAMTNEEWMNAWVIEWQRANRAEAELEEVRERLGNDTADAWEETMRLRAERADTWDEAQSAIWDETVCSVCGRNHDRDESAACDGCEPVSFRDWVEGHRV